MKREPEPNLCGWLRIPPRGRWHCVAVGLRGHVRDELDRQTEGLRSVDTTILRQGIDPNRRDGGPAA